MKNRKKSVRKPTSPPPTFPPCCQNQMTLSAYALYPVPPLSHTTAPVLTWTDMTNSDETLLPLTMFQGKKNKNKKVAYLEDAENCSLELFL